MEIRANRQPAYWGNGIELRLVDIDSQSCVKNVVLTRVDVGDIIPAPIKLKPHDAQFLMDQLWDCGVRPTEGFGSAGAMSAVQNHLADMKEIAFHALKISR